MWPWRVKMPTQNLLRLLLLPMLMLTNVLTTVWCRFGRWNLVKKLNFLVYGFSPFLCVINSCMIIDCPHPCSCLTIISFFFFSFYWWPLPLSSPPSAPLIPRCPIVYRPGPARSLKNRPIHFQLTSFLSRFETICVEIAGSFTLFRNSDKKSSKTVFFSFLKFDCSPISKSLLERSNRKQKRVSSDWGWFVINFVASIKRDQVKTYLEQN